MRITEHIDVLRREGGLLAEAASAADLAERVHREGDSALLDLWRETATVRWS